MKNIFLTLLACLIAGISFSQTVAFHENFESPSLADSVVTSGNPGWHVGTYLHNSGLRADTSRVAQNDSTFLTTNAFSTTGNYFVILQFSHICKVEFFDNAIIQVSNNNGVTWTQLTAAQYLGTGQFAANGNKFASTSYTDWLPGTPMAVPTNSWWKTEQFDISSLVGNSSQVKVRFKLSDGNGTGAGGNWGWEVDDIKVTMNYSELNPPVITLLAPNYSNTVYTLGPFPVKAKITDASGIDTAKIFYTINGGAPLAVGMTMLTTDTFRGYIPAVSNLDTVCYYVFAQDASPNHNSAQAPVSGCNSFVASSGIIFPFIDNFDGFSNWTANTQSAGTIWELGTPNYGQTNSAHSAPNAWDVNLNTTYGAYSNTTLTSPVFNFSTAVNATLSFWQNRNVEAYYDGTRLEYTTDGTTWQVLGTMGDPNGVNWYTNSSIYASGMAAWDGTSSGWIKSEYLLSSLNNVSGPVQFRFIFTSDYSTGYDGFSIDDFSIVLPSAQDAGVTSVITPVLPGCIAGTPTLSVIIKNYGTQNIVGPFNVAYQIDGNTPVTEQYLGTITPGGTDTMTFATPITTTAAAHSIHVFTQLPSDGNYLNDTLASTFNLVAPLAVPYFNPLDAASDLADLCITTGTYGYADINAVAAHTGASGLVMGSSSYNGWTTYNPDTITSSPYYIWSPTVNDQQYAQARLIINSAGQTNLVLRFDLKLNYLYGDNYTHFRVMINGVMVSPHLTTHGGATPYTTYEYLLTPFLPSPTLTIEFQSKAYYPWNNTPNGDGAFIDNIWIFRPPEQEAKMVKIIEPSTGCGLGSEVVKVKIKNVGSDTISGNFNASYKVIGGSTIVTEAIPNAILPNDTFDFSFATPVNLAVTAVDSTFDLMAWVTLVGDTIHTNDTVFKSVASRHVPSAPVSADVTIPYATSATLHATSADSIFWYTVPAGGNAVSNSSTYITPLLYDTVVYYAESRPVSPGIEFMVGTGTLQNSSSTYPCPYGQFYNGARQQFMITASDLSAAGMVAGPIEAISFDVVTPVTTGLINYNIKLGTTQQSSLTTWVTAGMTTVYSTPLFTTVSGWNVHTLSTPWSWDGVSNLIVETCFDNYPNGYTTNAIVNQTATSYVSTLDTHSDNGSVCNNAAPLSTIYQYNQRPNIKFKATSLGCPSTRTPVTVYVNGIPAIDASAMIIYKPVTGIDLSANEPVQVKIKNYGTAPVSSLPVSYKIDGNPAVNEVIPSTINAGDTLLYTFSHSADLSAYGPYSFKAYTAMPGDTTHLNDTAYVNVKNLMLAYCVSTAMYNYDCDLGNVTISNINNGNPNPVYSNPAAVNLYTDFTTSVTPVYLSLGNDYPISISQINQYSTFSDSYVAVYIDFNKDGTFDPVSERVFGAPTSSLATTVTGTVSVPFTAAVGYTRMRVVLQEYGDSTTTLPCGTYSYGETEDYIVRIAPLIPHDAGVTAFIKPTLQEVEAASIPVKVIVKNFGTDTITSMNVAYSMNGGSVVSQAWSGSLLPTLTDTVTMANLTVPAGYNDICAYTVLAGDSNTFNDKTCLHFYGQPLQDGGVISINQPGGMVTSGASTSVQVTVQNFGVNAITSMNLAYTINGGSPVVQPWTGSLAPGTTTNVTLPNFTAPAASFNICAYAIVVGDGDHSNDTTCGLSYGLFKDTLSFYDNFDGPLVAWFDQSQTFDTKWELGTPSYGVTSSAHSAPNAWDINLLSGYGSYAVSYLYTQIFDFSNAVNAKLAFWQNRYTETGFDGTRLEYTINGGTTWTTLGAMNDPNGVNWYTSASISSSSKPAWEGASNGWQKSEYKCTILNSQPNVQFRFVFTSDGSVTYDGFSIDDFSIKLPQHIDAGVTAISSPGTQTAAGSVVHVKVKLENFGSDTLTSIPVSYKINSSAFINAMWSGVLHPGDTISYTFPQTYISPSGQYNLCAYTGLVNDGDHMNDTTCLIVGGIPAVYVTYTDNFEGPNYFSSADGNASWERGVPTASVINTAHSPVNCWKTNLDGNYINNCNDNLYTPKLNFSFVQDTAVLTFWHWYETEPATDGGNIQYSVNGGTTWITLGYQNDPLATNWYNSMINGKPAWSGSSAGWVKSTYKIVKSAQFNNFLSLIQFRFNFYSNAYTSSYDGWAVDDFAVIAPQIPIDAGVSAIMNPAGPTVMASSVTVTSRIKNLGTDPLYTIPLYYKVNNGTAVAGTWTGTLLPDSTVDYTFTTPYTSPVQQYKLCSYTKVTNDTYTYNDTSCLYMFPAPGPIDAGVSRIITPGTATPSGSLVTVSVKLQNYGTDTLTSMNVSYQINLGVSNTETWTGILLPGDSTTFTFSNAFNAPISQYNLCAYTTCLNDPNPFNDKFCRNILIGSGIEESEIDGLIVGQNIPNPANDQTEIYYVLPSSGNLNFTISDIYGRNIYQQLSSGNAGKHSIYLDTNSWADGVYFYAIEFNRQRIVRKLVVSH